MRAGLNSEPEVRSALERAEASEVPGALAGARLGAWQLVRFVGRGGMADVYTARPVDGTAPRRVALKLMLPRVLAQPALVELFLHEARLSALMQHENLAPCLDFGVLGGAPFMVLEHVEGIPLDAVLRWMSARRPIPAAIALGVIRGLTRALGFAHALADGHGIPLGVVHRDVSPGNVLLDEHGTVKLIDFGVAQSALSPREPRRRKLRGKLGYMSPEQVAGVELDARSDLFGVGILGAELLLGNRLFPGGNELRVLLGNLEADTRSLGELRDRVSSRTLDLLERALRRDRNDRFQSAAELESALDEAIAEEGGSADGSDLVAWLSSSGLRASVSGVREAPARSENAPDVEQKVASARRSVTHSLSPTPIPKLGTPRSGALHAARPPVYRAIRDGKRAPEIIRFAHLLEQLATGRAPSDIRVGEPGTELRPAHAISTFASLTRLPAFRFEEGAERRAEIERRFARRELPALLFRFAERGARGLLTVRTEEAIHRVYFDDGAPCFACGSDPTKLLGAILVERGILFEDELEAFLYLAAREGRHLGESLVSARRVAPSILIDALVSQLEARVAAIAAIEHGEMSFSPGERAGVAVPRPLGSRAVIAYRTLHSAFDDAAIRSIVSELDALPIVRAPERELDSELDLTDTEWRVIEAADGSRTVRLQAKLLQQGLMGSAIRRAIFFALSAGRLVSPGFIVPW
jgi:serine/threonine protein kinase